jgi:hypothetical protein
LALAVACGATASRDDEPGSDGDVIVGSSTGASGEAALSDGQIVYVAFDGVRVDDCAEPCSDATQNRSWAIHAHFGATSIDFAPYPGEAARQTVLAGLRAAYAPYRVSFTTERPTDGPYTMVVVSVTGGPNHGVAPLDCGNANPSDIAFVYRTALSSPALVAREAAHELGHSFGLGHVASRADFMEWASSGSRFTVAPYDVAHESGKCFDGDEQDAPALLAASLGRNP